MKKYWTVTVERLPRKHCLTKEEGLVAYGKYCAENPGNNVALIAPNGYPEIEYWGRRKKG